MHNITLMTRTESSWLHVWEMAITYTVRQAPFDDLVISFWIFWLQRIMRGESENMHDIAEIQWPGIDIHDEVDLAAVRGRLAPTAVGSQLHVGKCFPNALWSMFRPLSKIRAAYAYRDLGQYRAKVWVEGTERKARSVDILTQWLWFNLAQEKYQHRSHALLLLLTGYQP